MREDNHRLILTSRVGMTGSYAPLSYLEVDEVVRK
jgi:hypothetical protein